MEKVKEEREDVQKIKKILNKQAIEPAKINPHFEKIYSALITEKQKAGKLLLRPEIEL